MTSNQNIICWFIGCLFIFGCSSAALPPLSKNPILQQTSKHNSIAQCEQQSNNQVALSECLQRVMNSLDELLNKQQKLVEKNVLELANITGRDDALQAFSRSQQQFIDYRTAQCNYLYQAMMPGSGAAIAFKKCYIELTDLTLKQIKN